MRYLTPSTFALSLLLCAAQTHAQTAAAPAPPLASAPLPDDLPITAPPNSTVQVDMDVRDDDLLGVFKSMLKGVSEGGQAAVAAQSPSAVPVRSGSYADMGRQVAGMVSRADLGDILKDVTHVRFLVYQLKPSADAAPVRAVTGKKPVSFDPPPASPDLTPQYETAFAAEGGHRILYVNSAPVHVVMTSFGHAHGSALVVQGPGTLAVMRVNGYPDLSKLSALATQIGTVAAQAAAANKPTPDK